MNALRAAASCVSDAVPCDDGGGTVDGTGVFVLVAVVVAVVVLFGVVLLGRRR